VTPLQVGLSVALLLMILTLLLYLGRGYWAWVVTVAIALVGWAVTGNESPRAYAAAVGALLVAALVFGVPVLRRWVVTRWLMRPVGAMLPRMGDTERIALEAGTVWWDGDLFSGNPDWRKLLDFNARRLSDKEPGRSRPGAVHDAGRVDDQPGGRSLPRGLGVHQAASLLRHDHSRGIRRSRLLRHCSFGCRDQARQPQRDRRGDRDGAELSGPRRAAAPLRNRGTETLLPASARHRSGDSLLRPDRAGGRQRRGRYAEPRHRLPRDVRGPRGPRHEAELAQAVHHPRPRLDRDRPRLSPARSRASPGRDRGPGDLMRPGAVAPARDRNRHAPRSDGHPVPEWPEHWP